MVGRDLEDDACSRTLAVELDESLLGTRIVEPRAEIVKPGCESIESPSTMASEVVLLRPSLLLTEMSALASGMRVVWSVRRKNRLLHALPRAAIRDLVVGSKVRIIGTARSLGQAVGGHISGTLCHSWISTTTSSGGNTMPPYEDRVVAFKV